MSNDPHFYHYTKDGFIQQPCPLNFDLGGEGAEFKAVMELNGWAERISYGSEYVLLMTVYSPVGNDNGDHLVELSDQFTGLWMAIVPASQWPRFIREEVMPVMKSAAEELARMELERIANTIITIGRGGIGNRDINEISGTSNADERRRLEEHRRKRSGS